jgi:hypothetical protein
MLEFERKLEKQNEDIKNKYFGSTSKRPITSKSSAMSMKKEAFPISTVSKVRIDSDVSKGLATKAEQHNTLFEYITSRRTSLTTEKHEKRMKSARLDFLGAKGVIHLSSDYCIIDEDQAPTSNKGGLPAYLESAEPISKSAEPITACPELARPTTPATLPASARVNLADFQSAKLTSSIPAVVELLPGDLTPLVDWFLEMKSNVIQIKDVHSSNMINKVENINILLKFQYGHTISISASIRYILANSCNRPIENCNLFVDDKINSDSISQQIVPYGKANSGSLSKVKLLRSNCKGVAKWIDNKFDRFVCLALKPTP